MKEFFKTVLATMVGVILASVVGFFLFVFLIVALVSSGDKKEEKLKDNSVLHIQLSEPVKERTSKNPFDNFDFGSFSSKKSQPGLNDILQEIKYAKTDEHIKGIFLDVPSVSMGMATMEEIRNALIDFKSSRKFIYAYAENYTQGAYYLVSVADKIYLNPQGSLTLNGLSTQIMFYKGTLDKLEIEPQIIRHGKFKSAVEPFIRENMSEENREQVAGFINPIWNHITTNIATARKLTVEGINQMADSLKISEASDALNYKLVDKLAYYDEFLGDLNAKVGNKNDEAPEFITLNKYKNTAISTSTAPDKIAVIYANGEISGGEGDDDKIGSETLASTIAEARKDDKVKAIVLRVNSPGGDALASDVIWREVTLAKKVKPVVVSMGDLAASGGYYISCAANKIVAEPTTLTGSIGVFGLMFNAQNMFKNKLGVTFDTYKTNSYGDIGTMSRPMTESEKLIIQRSVDQVYNTFTSRVAEGRKMTQASVDSIGQGRVWSGVDAKRIGLVDEIGNINDAIKSAAALAKINEYRIKSMPEQKEPFEEIMSGFSEEAKTWYFQSTLGDQYFILKELQSIKAKQGVQARTFYNVSF
ncbi:MAG: signal peptide peptidase SppA [Bacteroidota bacterium]